MIQPQVYECIDASRTCGKFVYQTALVESRTIPGLWYKPELFQPTGSFKWRGAVNAFLSLIKNKGKFSPLICASTGNHGLAVASIAKRFNHQVQVVLSNLTPRNKVDALKKAGAKVLQDGDSQDDAFKIANSMVEEQSGILISQFKTREVIIGHMTIALEIVNELPNVDTLLIPLSGGGLFAGVALLMKHVSPHCRLVGVSMERGAAMHASISAGHIVTVEEEPSLADSLGGGVDQWTYEITKKYIDDLILVNEESIYRAIYDIYVNDGMVVEGAAAVGVAAIQSGQVKLSQKTVSILSGMNIDRYTHQRIVNQEPVFLDKLENDKNDKKTVACYQK